jgi:hypothetical protein
MIRRREFITLLGGAAPWHIKYAALRALFTVLVRRRGRIQRTV